MDTIDTMQNSYIKGIVDVEYPPRVLCIEPTNACNFRCTSCFRPNDKVQFLNPHLLRKWVEREPEIFRSAPIWLHFSGESLLHPFLSDLIQVLEEFGVELMLSTNAALMNDKHIDMLLGSKLSLIVFSLDAATASTYSKIRIGGDFSVVENNVLNFLHRRGKAERPLTQAQLVLSNQALEEVLTFIYRWAAAGIDTVHIKRFSTRGGQIPIPVGALDRISEKTTRQPCFDPWCNVVIRVDGTVVPCCADFNGDIALGTLEEHSIREIWLGEKAKALRKAHVTGCGLPELCKNCNDYRTFEPGDVLTDSLVLHDLPKSVETLQELLRGKPRHLLFVL